MPILAFLLHDVTRRKDDASLVARKYRLREESDVQRVRSRGQAVAHGPLVARILPNTLDPTQNRYAIIAGKRCGKAVQRNRLKRLVREALRGYHPHLEHGFDIVVICRGTEEEMPTLREAQKALRNILTHAKLLRPDSEAPEPGASITTGWNEMDVPPKGPAAAEGKLA